MTAEVVVLEGLEVRFGTSFRLAVEALSIERGETVACIGPSGSGKTTLLNVVAGLLRPERGLVWTAGHDLARLNDAQRRALRRTALGFVFQELELVDYLDARDNILLPTWVGAGPTRADRERAEALARGLGIGALLDRRPARLSQGERQRVAIARALVARPQLLLCDEPTGNLDPDTTRETVDLLLAQAAENDAAVLFVTHDHSLLERFDGFLDLGEGADA